MSEIRINYRPYGQKETLDVRIWEALPEQFNLTFHHFGRRCLLVVDNKVQEFAQQVGDKLMADGHEVAYAMLDATHKNLATATHIWEAMTRTQPDFAVAIGGGAICDLTGFTSSCYRRGIPTILFPTTLLAMADVCISGKTGIDFANIKNSIGTIHFPRVSICVLETLRTLDEFDFRSGLSEMVKISVTSDDSLFSYLESLAPVIGPECPDLPGVIAHSCRLKANIVEGSPLVRLYSLYGHLVGQAIEALHIGRDRHGDCVSIGLHYEGYIAYKLGIWDKDSWLRQMDLLLSLGLPVDMPGDVGVDALLCQMQKDKLSKGGSFNMILPRCIGQVNIIGDDPRTNVPYDFTKDCLTELIS